MSPTENDVALLRRHGVGVIKRLNLLIGQLAAVRSHRNDKRIATCV